MFCFQVFPFCADHLAQFCGSNLGNTLEEFLQLMDLLDLVGPESRSRWHQRVRSPRGDAVPDMANIDFYLMLTSTSTQGWVQSTLAAKGQGRDLFVIRQKFRELRKNCEDVFAGKWLLSVCWVCFFVFFFTADVSCCACFCFLGLMNLRLSVIF